MNKIIKKDLYEWFVLHKYSKNIEYNLVKYNGIKYLINKKNNKVVQALCARDGYSAYYTYGFLCDYGIFYSPSDKERLEIERYEDKL
jgi:hypothetical protein